MNTVLMIGAASDIAKAIAHRFAAAGFNLQLAARSEEELSALVADYSIRYGVTVSSYVLDIIDTSAHAEFWNSLEPKPDVVVCAVGYLGDQKKAETDFEETMKIIDVNFSGCVSILNIAAQAYESIKSGSIIGISSVAGDRGRKKNYFYGSAKAALTAYLSGLRQRLHSAGVHVLTVKPGFVATRMTEGMDIPKKLNADPARVAEDIFRAFKKRKSVLYTPAKWRWIMAAAKHIPESIFKKKEF